MAVLAKDEEYIPRYSYTDYKQWEGDWELIRGIPYAMSPAPVIRHQEVSFNIAVELKEKSKECDKCKSLQAVDWKIDHETVVCPDNLLVCGEDIGEAYLTKTPEIIFEVLSPSTMFKDRNVKYRLYEAMGVNYYVLVDTSAKVAEVFRLADGLYHKEKNAQDELFSFLLEKCVIEFDFAKIW
ncbi:MAG: Uma2 family endonuclease [Sulfurospirillum sp.]|nr:MAG: Uma2 family endonuclease [Sulfurospirillum sp.]